MLYCYISYCYVWIYVFIGFEWKYFKYLWIKGIGIVLYKFVWVEFCWVFLDGRVVCDCLGVDDDLSVFGDVEFESFVWIKSCMRCKYGGDGVEMQSFFDDGFYVGEVLNVGFFYVMIFFYYNIQFCVSFGLDVGVEKNF